MKTKIVGIGVGVVAVAAAVVLGLAYGRKPAEPVEEPAENVRQEVKTAPVKEAPKARPARAKRTNEGKDGKKRRAKDFLAQRRAAVDTRSPADRELADRVQEALDAEDLKQTKALAAEALKSKNQEVRLDAVDALGWFGDKALLDLTRLMADKDREVAERARDHVETALMGMEDDDMAFATAASFLEVYGDDREASTMLFGILSSAGGQIVDPEDSTSVEQVKKALGNRVGIVELLAGLIEKGGETAASAKESYELITGEEWKGRAAADVWAADIEMPESEEEPEEDAEAESEE